LYEIISKEEILFEEIEEFLKNNEGESIDPNLRNLAIKVKTNIYIKEMMTKLTESLETFDAVSLRTQFDDINAKNIILPNEFLDKIEDMLYDAEGNENY